MLSVSFLGIGSAEAPIVGCKILPTVVLCLPDNTLTSDDATASAPIAGSYLKYKWSRFICCHVHPSEPSMLQCLYCAKHKSLVGRSHHCSAKCYQDALPDHKAAHEIAQKANNKADLIHTYSHHAPAYCPQQQEPESVVGNGITYTPTANDIGCVLKIEVTVISVQTGAVLGEATEYKTLPVVASIPPPMTGLVDTEVTWTGFYKADDSSSSQGRRDTQHFTVTEAEMLRVSAQTGAVLGEATEYKTLPVVASIPPPMTGLVDTEVTGTGFYKADDSSSSQGRRDTQHFTVTEAEILVSALEEVGIGNWAQVKRVAFGESRRTKEDLRDKWRTLVRTATTPPDKRRGERIPQSILDRVLRLI